MTHDPLDLAPVAGQNQSRRSAQPLRIGSYGAVWRRAECWRTRRYEGFRDAIVTQAAEGVTQMIDHTRRTNAG